MVLGFTLAIVLGGCGGPSTATPRSPASFAQQPSPSQLLPLAASAPQRLQVSIGRVDTKFTTPLLEVATDGEVIVWSSGANAGEHVAPDLFRLIPGASPTVVYRSADRSASLGPIAVAGEQIAFVEANPESHPGAWTLWLLSRGAKPRVVDSSGRDSVPRGPYPTIALGKDRLVWAAFHKRQSGLRSELRQLVVASNRVSVIDATPLDVQEHWFPSVDGERLVYGTVERSFGAALRHVYYTNLGKPGDRPLRLDATGTASQPAINGNQVVWKESPDNVFEWGTLVQYSLSDHVAEPIAWNAGTPVTTPSIGSGYIAANSQDDTQFYVHDLARHEMIAIETFPRTGREGDVRPMTRSGLLVWSHIPSTQGQPLVLEWTRLP